VLTDVLTDVGVKVLPGGMFIERTLADGVVVVVVVAAVVDGGIM